MAKQQKQIHPNDSWLVDDSTGRVIGVQTAKVSTPTLLYGSSDTTASRNLTSADAETVVKCNSASAIVLTILSDANGGFSYDCTIAAYQAGAGAISFAAGSGVTLRGTATVVAQYGTIGVMRVGANEWAYL